MTIALLLLAAAVLALAGAQLFSAWAGMLHRYPEPLTDEEIRDSIAPTVAALLIMADQNADPPIDDWAGPVG